MPKYAIYDSTKSAPSPVFGWYDEDFLPLANPPAAADLLALTDAEWASRMAGQLAVSNGALVAYTPPVIPPTLAQQAAAALNAGITITSTATPALDGVYEVNTQAQNNIASVQLYINTNVKFPGSSGTYPWLDASGTPHIFPSVTEFQAFSTKVADYVADLTMIILTGQGTLPPATATIP